MPERTITPLRGGDLITEFSGEQVGPHHCMVKENIRFNKGKEEVIRGNDYYQEKLGLEETITLVHDVARPNGEHCTIIGTPTTLYRYNVDAESWWIIGEGFDPSANRWKAVNYDGYVFLNNGKDLPCYYRVEYSRLPKFLGLGDNKVYGYEDVPLAFAGEATPVVPMYELREQGIAYAEDMVVFSNTLVFINVTELVDKYLSIWMNGNDAYGRIQDTNPEYLTQTPFRIINSDYDATRWKLGVKASVSASQPKVIKTDFPVYSLRVLDEINFRETEEDGDDVEVFITRATIHNISEDRKEFSIEYSDGEPPITTDSTGFLTRYTWGQEVAGYLDHQSDGSAMLACLKAANRLIVFRETGFSTYYVSNGILIADRESYTGPYTLANRHLAIAVNDTEVLYRSKKEWFRINMTTLRPEEAEKLALVSNIFDWLSYEVSEVFMADDRLENTLWICCPDGVLAYDYRNEKAFTIDEGYSAVTVAWINGEEQLLMAKDGNILIRTDGYLRRGVAYEGRLVFGFMGEEASETTLETIIPYLASQSQDQVIKYRLYRVQSTVSSPQLFGEKSINPSGSGQIKVHARSPYFQEEILFPNAPVQYSGRKVLYRTTQTITSRFRST